MGTPHQHIQAWELLVRFHRRAVQSMDASLRQRFDLSLDDYDVLHQLRQAEGPLRMTELANRLLVANSSCNRIVGRLVDRGLVVRQPGPSDRRQVLVELTAEGRRVHRRMAAVHTRDIGRHLDGLDADGLAELERLLARVQPEPEPGSEPRPDAG